jgi:Flp pilus assembly protein TadD
MTPRPWIVAAVLAVSIGVVYLPALHVPFIFDDTATIVENASIAHLWPLVGSRDNPGPLNAPAGTPTAGRPLVNLSFAANYRLGGFDPSGYHAYSILIHWLNALLLWAIVRRTLLLDYFAGWFDQAARWLAFAVAMLWALHPLQSEAVVYATQRSEMMMALCYLATLYCSLRYWSVAFGGTAEGDRGHAESFARQRAVWLSLAVLSCLCGMASKEVMVSAPLMVLLFERTFIAGSLKTALHRSKSLYVGLVATWLLLAWLRLGLRHSEAAGFGLGVPAISWWLTQTKILLMYLKLAIWPWPLLIHYELPYLDNLGAAWIYVLPVLLLGIGTLVLLWQNSPVGYLGTWIFAILSPTCVVPIILEMAAERRMYLPLAALIVLFVVGLYLAAQRVFDAASASSTGNVARRPIAQVMVISVLIAVVCGLVSSKRVGAYHDKLGLWEDVLRLQPENDTAHVSIGHEFEEAGNLVAATGHYREAIRLAREPALAHFKLGVALMKQGANGEAVAHFEEAARLQPQNPLIRNNLAAGLFLAGRTHDAITACRTAIELQPNSWWCHNHLGMVLKSEGDYEAAVKSFERAIELKPDELGLYSDLADCYSHMNQPQRVITTLERGRDFATRANNSNCVRSFDARMGALRNADDPVAQKEYGLVLFNSSQYQEAIAEFTTVLKSAPDDVSILNYLGISLTRVGRVPEAIEILQHAIRVQPDNAEAHANLAQALGKADRVSEAIGESQAVATLKPNDPAVFNDLGILLAKMGRLPEAIESFEHALGIRADNIDAHINLGLALLQTGKRPQAIEQYRAALKLDPNNSDAHFNLGNALASSGDMERAIKEFLQAIALRPGQADMREVLGKALSQVGRHKEAIEAYRAALVADPSYLPTYEKLTAALVDDNRSEEAIASARKGIEAARAVGQETTARQIEEWLTKYQSGLGRHAEPTQPTEAPPAKKQTAGSTEAI